MPYTGMLRRVVLVRTDVSVGLIASMNRMTRIGESSALRLLVTANVPSSPMMRAIQEPHGVTSQKIAAYLIVIAVKTQIFRSA
jgi:hypothetical protein